MSRSFREKKQHGFTYTVTLKCSAMYSFKNLDVSELLSPVKRPPLTLMTDHIMEATTYILRNLGGHLREVRLYRLN